MLELASYHTNREHTNSKAHKVYLCLAQDENLKNHMSLVCTLQVDLQLTARIKTNLKHTYNKIFMKESSIRVIRNKIMVANHYRKELYTKIAVREK